MKKRTLTRHGLTAITVVTTLCAITTQSVAYELSKTDQTELNLDVESLIGVFHSDNSYAQVRSVEDSVNWQEAYLKIGLSGLTKLGSGELFGKANVIAVGTFGDGDPAGFTTGDEREADIEDLYVGWRNELFEVSVGSQNFVLGDGWLINGDPLNFGDGFSDIPGAPDFSRGGGAYWAAAKKAFKNTAVVRVGRETGLRGDAFYLKSDNPASAEVELAGINFEHVSDKGSFSLYYVKGLGVEDNEAQFLGVTSRDGQENFGARYQGNAGVENLFLSAEYTSQKQGDDTRQDADAWYLEGGWTLADVPWSPSINYRYSQFDTDFDPLFYGFNRGYGTWFQGEVAGNYAGPYNTDSDIHYLGLKATPTETLTLGALFFDFAGDQNTSADAQELNFYAEWWVTGNVMISPVIGIYDPDRPAAEGGIQIGSGKNTYAQVFALFVF